MFFGFFEVLLSMSLEWQSKMQDKQYRNSKCFQDNFLLIDFLSSHYLYTMISLSSGKYQKKNYVKCFHKRNFGYW